MTTILFVHGTGTREPKHTQIFTQEIRKPLQAFRSDWKIESCFWGKKYGAALNKEGKSIPRYDLPRGAAAYTEQEIALWKKLYDDPLYELRNLSRPLDEFSSRPAGQSRARQELNSYVQTLNLSSFPQLESKLKKAGITKEFEKALRDVAQSSEYIAALRCITRDVSLYQIVIAKAIVAKAVKQCILDEKYVVILYDASLRDDVVQPVFEALGGSGHPVKDWLVEKLLGAIETLWLDRNRAAITDFSFPLAGDILLYQQRGDGIRDCIRRDIENIDPPVILLAHSLGGVACVDVLLQEPRLEQVKLLITVGSQASFFYEINALHGLSYKQPLPQTYPTWLNIYDQRDLLAFVCEEVFGQVENNEQRVQDVQVNNKQPFPLVHSAYWQNKDTWKAITQKICEVLTIR